MPWYWTDHLAGLLNSTRPIDIPQTGAWVTSPIAIRVEPGANPLVVAEELVAEEDDPESTGVRAAA